MIFVRALGPVDVRVNGAAAPTELLWHKNLALLVYLARSPRRVREREHLYGLLWGDKPDEKARRSLNEALSKLRRSVGNGAIESDSTLIRIRPDAVEFDTDRLDSLAGTGDYAGAAALVHGEFLEGFSVPGAPEFDLWLATERDHWRRRSVDVLVHRAEQLLAVGSVATAIEVARRAQTLDWRSEQAVRAVMRGLALLGDRTGALAACEAFTARLQQELGATPDGETRALTERVRKEKIWKVPRDTPAPVARAAPLVGRAAELRRLVDAWDACRAKRRAAIVVIEGDAGAGKTRLAEELAARARLDGATVAAVRAVEADRSEAWSGVFGIARGGLLDAPGAAGAPPAALAQLRAAAALASPRRALSELLQAVADERPVLLLLDDAHWLDRESLLALGAAVRDLARARVLVAITAARQPPCAELDELRTRIGREVDGAVLHLQPFGAEDVRELAQLALPTYQPAQLDRVTRRVLVDSAGIPLLVTALLTAVAAGLELREGARAWPEPNRTLNDTLPGELPDNVVAAVRVNFPRLSANAQRVLVAAAVLGGRVSLARLERASSIRGEGLDQALDELEWQQWLTPEPRGYAFVARIVRDIVDRDMVKEGERQRIREAGS